MRNQFFYTRKESIKPKEEGEAITFKEFRDSFNVEKVNKTIQLADKTVLVLLNDIHQRIEDVPIKNKRNEITGWKKQTNTYQTEILLSEEDGDRYFKLTNIEP